MTWLNVRDQNQLRIGKIFNFYSLPSDLLICNFQDIVDDGYILVSIDIWTFLKTWYDADYKIKVKIQPLF